MTIKHYIISDKYTSQVKEVLNEMKNNLSLKSSYFGKSNISLNTEDSSVSYDSVTGELTLYGVKSGLVNRTMVLFRKKNIPHKYIGTSFLESIGGEE